MKQYSLGGEYGTKSPWSIRMVLNEYYPMRDIFNLIQHHQFEVTPTKDPLYWSLVLLGDLR